MAVFPIAGIPCSSTLTEDIYSFSYVFSPCAERPTTMPTTQTTITKKLTDSAKGTSPPVVTTKRDKMQHSTTEVTKKPKYSTKLLQTTPSPVPDTPGKAKQTDSKIVPIVVPVVVILIVVVFLIAGKIPFVCIIS